VSKNLIDLAEDLSDLAREASTLMEEIELYLSDAESPGSARELLSKSGLASNTTRLYTGCEQIMEYLAKMVDDAPISHGDGSWHAALLKRMSNPWGDVRPPIISGQLYSELDRLRGFRHRERTSYGRVLDGSIVIDRAREMAKAAMCFKLEVETFLAARNDPEKRCVS
jgi:hypothetical protein